MEIDIEIEIEIEVVIVVLCRALGGLIGDKGQCSRCKMSSRGRVLPPLTF